MPRFSPRTAADLFRSTRPPLEFWPQLDPSVVEGSRKVRLDAHRTLRGDLLAHLRHRFPPRGAPVVG